MRDDFNKPTKDRIAASVAHYCSNPDCRRLTLGPNAARDGKLNLGVAAHITAAATGGPRFSGNLTKEQRVHADNGIWLCQDCAKLIDSDARHYTIELLWGWKQRAQDWAFQQVTAPRRDLLRVRMVDIAPTPAANPIADRLRAAAVADLDALHRLSSWPQHPVDLNLHVIGADDGPSFSIANIPQGIEVAREICVVAPPGTGKTTTLLQLADLLLQSGGPIGLFIPLGEWAVQGQSLLRSVAARSAFREVSEQELEELAEQDQLVLLLDGWNELTAEPRARLRAELGRMRREMPLLRIVTSTRRQALDVPVNGPKLGVELLSEDQQLEIARALAGEPGEVIVDRAWRTAGVRELVAIPLYLNALLSWAPGGALPSTREEVLRLFVEEHERTGEHTEALRQTFFDCHMALLTALATCVMRTGAVTLSEAQARAAVNLAGKALEQAGLIKAAPEPAIALGALVDHHLLIRVGQDGALAFQHQQFQEWYASFEVERAMVAAADGETAANDHLRIGIINEPAWEEAILFACERASADHGKAVANAILAALRIDPILASEMIYRSAPAVWELVREHVLQFVDRWHSPGRVDRAVRFMITSGRGEFSSRIWPLVMSSDQQVYLSALRSARRFRPSVLGSNPGRQIAALPEGRRGAVLGEIASNSGFEGMDLATALAKADASAEVQVEVISSLMFRRGDRHVAEFLAQAPEEVWSRIAANGYPDKLADPEANDHLRRARDRLLAGETNPARRLGILAAKAEAGETVEAQITDAVAAPDLPIGSNDNRWAVQRTYQRFPAAVAAGLVRRLAAGLDLPFGAKDMLADVAAIDEGPIAAAVLDLSTNKRGADAGVALIGPVTVGALIAALRATRRDLSAVSGPEAKPVRDRYCQLVERIADTRPTSFAEAVLAQPVFTTPEEIGMVADVVARHGGPDSRSPLLPDGVLKDRLAVMLHSWVEALLEDPDSKRHQLADVARAIGRVGHSNLIEDLHRLLDADLTRWREAREQRPAAWARGQRGDRTDASMSYVLQYRQAFVNLCGTAVEEMMAGYIEDPDFGFEAGCVLKEIWDRQHTTLGERRIMSGPDLTEIARQREQKQQPHAEPAAASPAEVIFAAVERLLHHDRGEQGLRQALALAPLAIGLPHGDKTAVIEGLVRSTEPILNKYRLYAALALDGEIIRADDILRAIRDFFDQAKTTTWMLSERQWQLDAWLELLPFSDRPIATLEGVELAEAATQGRHRRERIVFGLGIAPSPEAEGILDELARRFPQLANAYDWMKAFVARGTVSSLRRLLDLLEDPNWPAKHDRLNGWTLVEHIRGLAEANDSIKAELLARYRNSAGQQRDALELVLAEMGDPESTMAMVHSYANTGRRFDHRLEEAIRNTAVVKRPAAGMTGAYELHPVALVEMRRELFGMLTGDTAEASLGEGGLTAIDMVRDEYGSAPFEPRHPDILSGRPWPLAAQ